MARTKRVSNLSGNFTKIMFIILFAVMIFVLLKVYTKIDSDTRESVDILTVKVAVKPGDPILKENMDSGSMIKTDFDAAGKIKVKDKDGKEIEVDAVIKYADREKYYDTFASYYIRPLSPIYSDVVLYSIATTNPWITDLPDGYEVLYIDINYLDIGGKTLIPGDRIRMRSVYQVSPSMLKSDPTASDVVKKLADSYIGDGMSDVITTLPKASILFDDIRISDMLNSSGESILKLYMGVSKYPLAEREKLLADPKFVARLVPIKVGFVVDKANGTRLAEITQLQGAKLFYSTLERDIEDYITDFENINNSIISLTQTKTN